MHWGGLLIDLVILAGLGLALKRGWYLGLMRVVFDTTSLAASSIIGLVAYQHLSPWLGQHASIAPVLTPIVAFAIIWLLLELLYALIWRFRPRPTRHHHSSLAQTVAAAISGLGYMVLVGFVVIVAVGLPLSTSLKSAINNSRISAAILDSTNQLQSQLSRVINQDLASTLNFLTTEPESDTSTISLGFRVAHGKVRPDLEADMIKLLNQERTSRGLSALTVNTKAQAVAIAHSQDMFTRGYFSHYTPEGLDPFQRMRNGGVDYLDAGENLALAPTLALAHQGLMNSPPHRANILEPHFHTVGIGIIDGGRYGLMVTQDFTN